MSKKVKKKASSSKRTSKKVKQVSPSERPKSKKIVKSTVAKSNGKQFVRQRPHLLPSTLNNDNNISSDEDDQTVKAVAANSRITYAIAMNNRMVQEGCSNSGSNSGSSGGCGGTNVVNEQAAAVEEVQSQCVARYPKRNIRPVNYDEQLNAPSDDHFIC